MHVRPMEGTLGFRNRTRPGPRGQGSQFSPYFLIPPVSVTLFELNVPLHSIEETGDHHHHG
jgi:hypothetical protein